MAIISFSDQPREIWCVAGWAFRQLLDDVISQHPDDEEMAAKLEASKTYGGLVLYLLKPEMAEKIATSIRKVAEGILSGLINQTYGDTVTIGQYRSPLKELLDALPMRTRAIFQKVIFRPSTFQHIPVFSRKAAEGLDALLTSSGELLPFRANQDEFLAFNVTVLVSALSRQNSDIVYFTSGKLWT